MLKKLTLLLVLTALFATVIAVNGFAAHVHDYQWVQQKTPAQVYQHRKQCSCGAYDLSIPWTNCSGGDPATCTTKSVCATCNFEYGNFKHEFATTSTSDDDMTHSRKCANCSEVTGKTNHSFLSRFDDNNHWKICRWCEYKSADEAHSLVYESTAEGHMAACGNCNYVLPLTPHKPVWKKDATDHWSVCDDCGYEISGKAPHAGGVATCKDPAVCETCGAGYGELADHTFTTVYNPTANCLTEAKYNTVCSVCGLVIEGEILGSHHYGPWAPIAEAQHTADCLNCGFTYEKPCAYIEFVDQDRAIQVCGVCGDVFIDGVQQAPAERVLDAILEEVDEGAIPPNAELVVFIFEDGYVLALEYFGEIVQPLGNVKITLPDATEFTIFECGKY